MSVGIGFYENDFFTVKRGIDLVRESITRIIMTNSGERVNNPFFGLDLRGYLFEPQDEDSKKQLLSSVKSQIEMEETRVTIVYLGLDEEDNYIKLNVKFAMKADENQQVENLSLTFENTQ